MLNILKECKFLGNVIGRFDFKKHLENIIDTDGPIPAILLCGEAGIGKNFCAKNIVSHIFSKDLGNAIKPLTSYSDFESNYDDILAKIDDNSIQDFHMIEKDNNERIIPSARIREELKFLSQKPQVFKHVCWIIEISNISEQGQNILLKSLEEAPNYVVFILLADNQSKVLNTIKSRSQTLLMPSLKEDELFSLYKNYFSRRFTCETETRREELIKSSLDNINSEVKIKSIIRIANGNPGKLLDLLRFEDFFEEIEEFIAKFKKFIFSAQGYALAEFYSWINGKYRNNCERMFELFTYIIHDFNLIRSINDVDLSIENKDLLSLYMSEQDAYIDKKQFILGKVYFPFWINDNFRIVSQIKSRSAFSESYMYMQEFMKGLVANANFEISLTSTLLKIHEVLTQ